MRVIGKGVLMLLCIAALVAVANVVQQVRSLIADQRDHAERLAERFTVRHIDDEVDGWE